MAQTALQHVQLALGYLGQLAPGGTPNAGQQTQGLLILNEMLEGYQAAAMLGFSKTRQLTGNSSTVSVSTAAVVTQTEIGGTVTTTLTPVAVSSFSTIGTSNTYPSGWDEMIGFDLAVHLSGPVGAPAPEWVQKRAVECKAALTPTNIQDVKVGAGA